MNRTITVKGVGAVQVAPNLIVVTMNLKSKHLEYDKAMQQAAEAVDRMTSAVVSSGFGKKDLKTTSFNVRTHYESFTDEHHNHKTKFAGYVCEQGLKLEFEFEQEMLGNVLDAVARSETNPRLDIRFSISDKDAVYEELLALATKNARLKAKALAKASDIRLGKLLSIEHDWSELRFDSPTHFGMPEGRMLAASAPAPHVEPDDIQVRDTATFVWEIL